MVDPTTASHKNTLGVINEPHHGHSHLTIQQPAINIGWFLPERDYVTFGSLLSQIRLPSVVCLSVCNVGAPYSGG